MNRARQVTLLLLALRVVAFAATWLTLPTERLDSLGDNPVNYPARLFSYGIVEGDRCRGYNNIPVDCGTGEYRQGANRRRFAVSEDESQRSNAA